METIKEIIPLTYLIYQADKAIHQSLNKVFLKSGIPLVVEQWPVLMEIYSHNGLAQGELARKTRKDKASLTRIIDTLVKNGMAERHDDLHDRRKWRVLATEKAISLRPLIAEVIKNYNEVLITGISREQAEETRKTLLHIFRSLGWEFDYADAKVLSE